MAAIHLNKKALEQAERLIKAGEIETFDTNWAAEKPTVDEVNHYLDSHYMDEYGMWFLGINPEVPKEVKEHYDYPYGDLKTVQRCALEDTIKRAEKAGHKDVVQVAKRLLEMVDKHGK
jgi:hypothetical protein